MFFRSFSSSSSTPVLILLFSCFGLKGTQCQCPIARCNVDKNFDVTTDLDAYYSPAQGFSGENLKKELNSIIREVTDKNGNVRQDHFNLSYKCVWVALAEADADPNDPERVIGLYSRNSFAKLNRHCGDNSGPDVWNREHVWATSHGEFKGESKYAYTDVHHLFVADKSINQFGRGNYDFKSGGNPLHDSGVDKLDDEDNKIKCGGCSVDKAAKTFEPPDVDNVKGQVARVMLYMDTRYEGGDGTNTPDLTLVEKATEMGDPKFGYLSELLKWHCKFPVKDRERRRNDVVQTWQGNRNPFVDRPDFVKGIWGEEYPEIFVDCKSSTTSRPTLPPTPDPSVVTTAPTPVVSESTRTKVWINEFHYDNLFGDVNEFVEIGCNGNIDLTGYKILLYNGSNGRVYDTVVLSGPEANCSPPDGFVTQNFDMIQNGPDGIALVDTSGSVIEFISYEGEFMANDGPAVEQTSIDVGVFESFFTSRQSSLQLVGEGCTKTDFTWQSPAPSSSGRVNDGQKINCLQPEVWINELHYDNAGADMNEFVEIGCNSNVDVTGYKVALYNGKNGKDYNTKTLSGECSPPSNFPVLKYENDLQNGNPGGDGIALVDTGGTVIEFISYEGAFTATEGLANGKTSVNIGVSESSSSSSTFSLQLVGEGCSREDFSWTAPALSSEGIANNGQNVCGLSVTTSDEL